MEATTTGYNIRSRTAGKPLASPPCLPPLDQTRQLLQKLISFQSVSGGEAPMVRYLAQWAMDRGFLADCFETDEATLPAHPCTKAKHIPLAGRPSLVIRLAGSGTGRTLLFNAHSDVVDAPKPETWQHSPWAGELENDHLYGRGACDTKGPLVSALLAMCELKSAYPDGLPGDVLLEIIPGEEDCVGLGTLTSVHRGVGADAVIILEPTESKPRCASRGGLRFRITLRGKAVHGTVKWLGHDALTDMRLALEALDDMQIAFQSLPHDISPHSRDASKLFAGYPFLRPITVDRIQGGNWQGMLMEEATCEGYFELLPTDDLPDWREIFTRELQRRLATQTGGRANCRIGFIEEYAGHLTDPDDVFCHTVSQAMGEQAPDWQGFNSGCEAGLRWGLFGTPTLVWGPGSLAQAHGADEYINIQDVRKTAMDMAQVAAAWTKLPTQDGRKK